MGWGELAGCGMRSMGGQWDGGIAWLWDWEGTEWQRDERGHCPAGPRGQGVAVGRPGSLGGARSHGLKLRGKQLCGRVEAQEAGGTGRMKAWPWDRSGPWTRMALWGCPPMSQLFPMSQRPRGGTPHPKLVASQKPWISDVTSHQADARAARPAPDLSLGRAEPAPPRAAGTGEDLGAPLHLDRAAFSQRGRIWHNILNNIP